MSDRNLVGNANDREQRKRADKIVRERDRQAKDDMLQVLRTAPGRRVLLGLIRHCEGWNEGNSRNDPMYEPGAPGSVLPNRAGRYDVSLHIIEKINDADPDALVNMLVEDRAARRRHESLLPTPQDTDDDGKEDED